ncbi:trypsin-like peptidase domain-containing protein [Streptosporangium sp. NPDC000563]|uniref:S1C family serine protease n=1 Tax=unclassified Streptosporangium TaxID=2632669 RepID=UPI0033243854
MVTSHDRLSGLGRPRGPGFTPGDPPLAAPPEEPGPRPGPAATARKAGAARVLVAAALVAAVTGGAAGVAGARLAGDGQAAPAALPRSTAGPVGSSGPAGAAGGLSGTAAKVLPSVVSVESGRGSGSGFVIDGSGHLLTNAHVLTGGAGVTVVLNDGRRLPATVVGTDAAYDLAVLRVNDTRALVPAELGRSADVAVGDQVLAIGSPLGLAGTVTGGIVSALDRQVRLGGNGSGGGQTALQTDASINPGNSGGPLVNARGEVIGINTAIATLSRRGSGSIGIGFAIPIDRAAPVAERIIRG